MQNQDIPKDIVIKLKSFTMLGYILIVFSVVYSAATYLSVQAKGGNPNESLIGGVVLLAIAAVFIYFGTKKRTLSFYDDFFEYRTNKVMFREKYSDIMILKSYYEKGRSSINILFVSYEDEEHKLTSAHYGESIIKEIFRIIYQKSNGNPDFVLEDEIGLLNDAA